MEPITLIGGITAILLNATRVSKALHDICGSYTEVPSTVKSLMHECYTINGALSQLQVWLCDENPTSRSKHRHVQLDFLVNTIVAAMDSFSELEAELEKFNSLDPRIMPFRYMWKETEMQAILQQLQNHKASLTLMLTILSSDSDSQTRKSLEEITAFMAVIAKDQQRIWYRMKRSNLSSTDGRSLFSGFSELSHAHPTRDTTVAESIVDSASTFSSNDESKFGEGGSNLSTRFTFDHDLKHTLPYQRHGGKDHLEDFDDKSVLTVEDVSDILNLSLPQFQDLINSGTIARRSDRFVGKKQFWNLSPVVNQNSAPGKVENFGQTPTTEYRRSQHKSVFWWVTTKDEVAKDWAEFWGMRSGDLQGVALAEISRQESMHTTIHSEILYHRDLDVFVTVYRYHLGFLEKSGMMDSSDPDIDAFKTALKTIFERFDILRALHEELVISLVTLAIREGPWVRGLADVYYEWLSKARELYLDYITTYCEVNIHIRRAIQHVLVAKQYLELCSQDEQTRGLDWHTLIKKPITQAQRMRFLKHTYPLDATDLERRHYGPNLPFEDFCKSIERRLEEETQGQVIKNFKSRLDIPEEFAGFVPKLQDMGSKSRVWRRGDLACYGFASGGKDSSQHLDAHVVVLDDYLLVTRRTHVRPKSPLKFGDEFESNRTRYVLVAKPLDLRLGYAVIDASTSRIGPPAIHPEKWWLSGSIKTSRMQHRFKLMMWNGFNGTNITPGMSTYFFSTSDASDNGSWISLISGFLIS